MFLSFCKTFFVIFCILVWHASLSFLHFAFHLPRFLEVVYISFALFSSSPLILILQLYLHDVILSNVLIGNFSLIRYKEDGRCRGVPEFTPPSPIRLKWEMPAACIEKIEASYQVYDSKFRFKIKIFH